MLAGIIGGWEIVLILTVILILTGAKRHRDLARGLGEGFSRFRRETDRVAHEVGESFGGIYGKRGAEALTPDNQTAELYDPAVFQDKNANGRSRKQGWLRRGFTFCRLIWRSVCSWLKTRT
jgi:sec-independent protein translocase protein TatA